MDEAVDRAIVALYNSENDAVENFRGSGVFIAPGIVLTAKHIFDRDPYKDLWARPYHGRPLRVREPPVVHPELDAAWLRVGDMPDGARSIALDRTLRHPKAAQFNLCGYFEGRLETEPNKTVTSYDDAARHHLVKPSHAKGMSGGALCIGDRLWALCFARYTGEDRGCVLAVHQMWSGFLDHIEGVSSVATVTRQPATKPRAGSAPSRTTRNQVKLALGPDGPLSPDVQALLEALAREIEKHAPAPSSSLSRATSTSDAAKAIFAAVDQSTPVDLITHVRGALLKHSRRHPRPPFDAPAKRVAVAVTALGLEQRVRQKQAAHDGSAARAVDGRCVALSLAVNALWADAGIAIDPQSGEQKPPNVISDLPPQEYGFLDIDDQVKAETLAHARQHLLHVPREQSLKSSSRGRASAAEVKSYVDQLVELFGGARLVVAIPSEHLPKGALDSRMADSLENDLGVLSFATDSVDDEELRGLAEQVGRDLTDLAALIKALETPAATTKTKTGRQTR